MRKFTTIFVAVVLCLAAFAVCASAKSTNCTITGGTHDWTAWKTVQELDDGSFIEERTCACGASQKETHGIHYYHTVEEIPAVAPTCTETGLTAGQMCVTCEEIAVAQEVIPALGHTLEVIPGYAATCLDAGLTDGSKCTVCGEIVVAQEEIAPIAHTIEHVEAKTVVCGDTEDGNIEYWYCTVCGYAWLDEACTLNTNLLSVVVPAAAEHTVEHVEAKTVVCGYEEEDGNIEYWYCTTCGFAWLDEACTLNTNLLSVVVPAAAEHTVEHVEAKTVVCGDTENGNIEYWYCTTCGYAWLDEECILNTNLLSVVVPAAAEHTVEHVEAKTVVCGDAENGNIEYWYCTTCGFAWLDEACTLNTNLLSVVVPAAAEHTVEHVEAKVATATEQGNIEYWYCTTCGFAWLDAELTQNTNLKAVILPALSEEHTIEHVEAKEATCFELGNIEYWYCTTCGYAWLDEACVLNTNLQAVKLPLAHEVEHVEAKEATCTELGNIEYWYCTKCGWAWLDSFCTLNTNLLAVNLPVAHEVEHVEAKEATCFELGNLEYWYCTKCGYAWLDEACTLNTNLQAVNLPLAHDVQHVEALAPTATENGNIEYWYCTKCGYAWLDSFCTLNTNLKAVILPATGETTEPEAPETTEPTQPDVPDEPAKPTGDNAIFFIVALVAVATLGVAAVSFKKREN